MRMTKAIFQEKVDDLSQVFGTKLYLVEVGYYIFISPTTSQIDSQYNHVFAMSNSYSQANFDKLMAFSNGVEMAAKMLNVNTVGNNRTDKASLQQIYNELQWLESHNKNYNNTQYSKISDLADYVKGMLSK